LGYDCTSHVAGERAAHVFLRKRPRFGRAYHQQLLNSRIRQVCVRTALATSIISPVVIKA
jgi:hypothetical protein